MKDQIDDLSFTLKERTNELRETQKYLKRLEMSLMKDIKEIYSHQDKLRDYQIADLKHEIHEKFNVISSKFNANNSNISNFKDNTEQQRFKIEQIIRINTRKLNTKVEQLRKEHDILAANYLDELRQNVYYKDLAVALVETLQMSRNIMLADEYDKETIALLGRVGSKDLPTSQADHQILKM